MTNWICCDHDLYLKNTLANHDAIMPLFASEWSQAANNFMILERGTIVEKGNASTISDAMVNKYLTI